MNTLNDIQNIQKNTLNNLATTTKNSISNIISQDFYSLLSYDSKDSFYDNFNDINNHKKDDKYSYKDKFINNKNVYMCNVSNLSQKEVDLISTLNNYLSNETNYENIEDTLEKINSILNKNSVEDSSSLIKGDVSVEDSSLEITEEMELTKNEAVIDEIIALLNFVNTETITESSDNISLDLTLDDSSVSCDMLSYDELSNNIDSIEANLADMLNNNPNANSETLNNFLEDFMGLVGTPVKETVFNFEQKEDIINVYNNLNISSTSTENILGDEVLDLKTNQIHPVARQLIASLQSQLSNVNLNDKTVELRLKLFPSKLGSISVVIEQGLNGFDVQILTENADVKNILSESLNDLKNQLEQFGLNSVLVDISHENKKGNDNNSNLNNKNDKQDIDALESSIMRVEADINLAHKILDIKY